MEKEHGDDDDGGDLPPELNQIKEQIEKERFQHINQTFELKCKPSVAIGSSHHETLAIIRASAEDNNGRDNNMLLSRMQTPLRYSNRGFIYDSDEDQDLLDDDDDEEDIAPCIKLPFVEKLPKSITWVLVNSNQLMSESDGVLTRPYYNHELEDGEEEEEVIEQNSEDEDADEETENYNYEFSEGEDRFIWEIGKKYDLNDVIVRSAMTKYLEVEFSDIVERFNELKLKNEETIGESSDSSTKSLISSFQAATDLRYCRRCLVFDCHTHEKSQPEIKPRDDELYVSETEDDRVQCNDHCYLKLSNNKGKNVVSDSITVNDHANSKMTIWTPEEKDLFLKGLEIFGRNSCLIAKNVLPELKTCLEVNNYMRARDERTTLFGYNLAIKPKKKVEFVKRKKLTRKKLKYNMRFRKHCRRRPRELRKTANTDNKLLKLYTPCTCDSICDDQCPCFTNDNCCEKYCGCWKECENRYGGCNCVMGQCVKRHCPCFAASRECDPDICRNCTLSCGDNSHVLNDQIQCKNMQFVLKKHKKVLIAKSDVHGWGAFSRYALKKNEFVGEYNGELISHSEADDRGIVEEHLGTSYLFTLNDQLDIDARRKGNKLKFVNHSEKPNCYAKLMVVRGDNRIGLYAMKEVEEGEELLFDYGYGPDQAEWYRGHSKSSSDE